MLVLAAQRRAPLLFSSVALTDISFSLHATQSRLLGFEYVMGAYFSVLDAVQLLRRHPDWPLPLRGVESCAHTVVDCCESTSCTQLSSAPSLLPTDWPGQAGAQLRRPLWGCT